MCAPEIAQGNWVRAKLGGDGASARHIDALQVLSARPGTSGSDQAFLWFAMHMAFDELGDHDAAWKALERACQAKRRLLEYDPADSRRLVEDRKSTRLNSSH